MIKHLLPFENIVYRTRLKEHIVLERIANQIEPFEASGPPILYGVGYEGKVEGNTFAITRIISYRNSFRPKISGEVMGSAQGTIIEVKMRLHFFILFFMVLWCGFWGAIFLAAQGEGGGDFLLIPLIGYAIFITAFKYESTKSKKHLATLFAAKIERE